MTLGATPGFIGIPAPSPSHERDCPGQDRRRLHDGRVGRPDGHRPPMSARGACVLPVDAIAALAGCSRTSVKNALRQAKLLGLILVKERRIPGRKSLTNIVTIISGASFLH